MTHFICGLMGSLFMSELCNVPLQGMTLVNGWVNINKTVQLV